MNWGKFCLIICSFMFLIFWRNPLNSPNSVCYAQETIPEKINRLEEEIINYPNLIHVFKKLIPLWDSHEKKEEEIFNMLEKNNLKIPIKQLLFDHKELKKHRKEMLKAINSGSEFKLRKALEKSGKIIIQKLKKHIEEEDEILYRITL